MLLTALREYAEANKDLPDFHSRQPVPCAIHLDRDGNFVAFVTVDKGSSMLTIPDMTRTSGDEPLPLDKGITPSAFPLGRRTMIVRKPTNEPPADTRHTWP